MTACIAWTRVYNSPPLKMGARLYPTCPLFSPKTTAMRQLLLNILPNPAPSQDNFITGHNDECLAAWLIWLGSKQPDTGFYLFGPSGAGKTHLLKASSFSYQDAASNPDLISIDSAHLDSDASDLAVDNVQQLSAIGQQNLFNTFNRLRAQGGRLLIAADKSPKNLSLREDLRTRLGYGLVYGLEPLDDDEKVKALTQLAKDRQLRIGSELIPYLIRHTPRDMGSLTTLLLALDSYSLEHQRPITLPLLRELLQLSSENNQTEHNP